MAGSEIEADGCSSRIHRPYKTTGFAPKVPYFAPLPLRLKPPPPIALASCVHAAAAAKFAAAFCAHAAAAVEIAAAFYASAATAVKLAAALFSMLLPLSLKASRPLSGFW